MAEFSERLKEAMQDNKMTITKLSNKTKISKPLLSNYLKGNYKAKQDNLFAIAQALNVSPVWLMGGDIAPIKDTKNEINFLDQYKILFDKDSNLTDTQRKFLMDFLIEQHKKQDQENNK